MPRKAKLLIIPTIVAGMGVLAACLCADCHFPEPARFVECLVLALLASTFKIRLPRMQSTISVSFVLLLIGIAELTLTETLLMGALATVVQCFWRSRTRPKVLQVLYNVAVLMIGILVAYGATETLRKSGAIVPELAVGSAILFLVTSGMVSLVLALVKSESALAIWKNCHKWAFPYYLGGSAIAAMITFYSHVCGWQQALAMLPLMYMLYACYESWMDAQSQTEAVPVR